MGLSESERKVLEELERGLYAEDAKFAERISAKGPQPQDAYRTPATRMIAGAMVALGGLMVILVGVIIHYIAIGVAGFAMTLAGVVIATSGRPSMPGKAGKPASGKKAPGGAAKLKPSNFFEERWDKRMNGE